MALIFILFLNLTVFSNENIKSNNFKGVEINPKSSLKFEYKLPDYIVKPGDTLSDICHQLLDNKDCWPELWYINSHYPMNITNPHLIYPGQLIKFNFNTYDNFLTKEQKKIKIDIDFSDYTYKKGNKTNQNELIFEGFVKKNNDNYFYIPGFIYKKSPVKLGYIISGIYNKNINVSEDKIIIKKIKNLKIDQKYSVIRYEKTIWSNLSKLGYYYSFIGNIKILNNMQKNYLSKAKIIFSKNGIKKNDIIVSYIEAKKKWPDLNKKYIAKDLYKANIIKFDLEKTFASTSDIAFINKGIKDGVGIGDIYNVYKKLKPYFNSLNYSNLNKLNPDAIIKIVDVTNIAASGVIVNSKMDIRLGDKLNPEI
jgi:hypothetical protein